MIARAWVAGRLKEGGPGESAGPADATLAMAREGGAPSETLAAIEASLDRADGLASPEWKGIWAQHLPALEAFLAACSQWRIAATHYLGLDYASADIAWRRLGIDLDAAGFRALQVIEAEAARLLNGGNANAPLEGQMAGGRT